MKTHVDESDARPAGRPGECFYCKRKAGEEHTFECVIPTRRVRLRLTVEYEAEVPRSWSQGNIEFHRNEGTNCIDNDVRAAHEYFLAQQDKEDSPCACRSGKVEYVGEAA